ncbi:MAG: hypothetical protein WB382_12280, partial [Pseudolabrys sp.]
HANGASTEDQTDSVLGEDGAESTGALDESWISARSRAAIDANFLDFAGFFASVHRYGCALHLRHRQGRS